MLSLRGPFLTKRTCSTKHEEGPRSLYEPRPFFSPCSFLAALLYQSTYPARRAITATVDSSLAATYCYGRPLPLRRGDRLRSPRRCPSERVVVGPCRVRSCSTRLRSSRRCPARPRPLRGWRHLRSRRSPPEAPP